MNGKLTKIRIDLLLVIVDPVKSDVLEILESRFCTRLVMNYSNFDYRLQVFKLSISFSYDK